MINNYFPNQLTEMEDRQKEDRQKLAEGFSAELFYKQQFLKFKRIGVGGYTEHNTLVTTQLINCTAKRLDQIISGQKTFKNMCRAEIMIKWGGLSRALSKDGRPLYNSNRSYIGKITSKFQLYDLEPQQQHSADYPNRYPCDHPVYIDKVTTAYKSDIMRAVLSHDN